MPLIYFPREDISFDNHNFYVNKCGAKILTSCLCDEKVLSNNNMKNMWINIDGFSLLRVYTTHISCHRKVLCA